MNNKLVSHLLDSADPAVRAKAIEAAALARQWARPVQQELSDKVYDTLAATVCVIAPELDVADHALLVEYSLWLYLLDGRLDDFEHYGTRPEDVGRRVLAVLRGGRAEARPGDFFETSLAALVEELRTRDGCCGLLERFVLRLVDGVRAGVRQAVLSRRIAEGVEPLPTMEDFLELAYRHVNYRSVALALLITVGEHPDSAAQERLDAALVPASRAVRLANDLRTCAKDAEEGTLNVVQLVARDGTRMTPHAVRDRIQAYRDEQALLLDELHPSAPASAAALENNLRVAIDLYTVDDLQFDLPDTEQVVG
ncbi:terpene synthase family protein [Streptomyces decoyicus]|uniref:terpene synthase family protein n=1 Tax=Streptomyces decoyicus TaxID=249567 RepID=UPI00381B48FE